MKRLSLASILAALAVSPAALAAPAEHGQDTLLTPFTDTVTNLVMIGILIFFAIVWRTGAIKAVFGSLDNRASIAPTIRRHSSSGSAPATYARAISDWFRKPANVTGSAPSSATRLA